MAYKEIDESEIILIDSVSSFIKNIKKVKEKKESKDGTSTELYFRGQETEFWDIEPSIFRDDMLSIEHKLMQIPLQKSPTEFRDLSYKGELSCMLQIRKHNLSGVYITFDQEMLFEDYFISETEFENKHHVGRYEDEEEICMQIQNMRINLNAHTAYHIYKLFEELKEEYFATKSEIDSILGTNGLSRVGNRYLLMTIDIMEWEEILFFARNHDWFQEDGEIEWNIFNNNYSRNSLILSPNVNGNIRGDILATISVIPNKTWNNKLDLYWEPGFNANERCMDRFDNVVKWKADYTAEWIKNRLLEKSHTYYEKCNGKKSL